MLALLVSCPSIAAAQVFGTLQWQTQPYCNVITLTLTYSAAGFTLDGTDDQCGATVKASAVGMAIFNPDGSVGLNFTIVTSPGAKPVHVAARVSPANGQGSWTDNVGNSGTFAFFGNTPGLPPRPLPASGLGASVVGTVELAPGAVGGTDINTAEVQARVTGVCPIGQYLRGINSDGPVVCQALPAGDQAGAVKTATFSFRYIPAAPGIMTLSSLTFVAPISGVVVLESRGYCNIYETAGPVDLAIAAGPNSTAAYDTALNPFTRWGLMRIPAGTTNLHELGWTTRNEETVVAGASYTRMLFAKHYTGTADDDNCSGTFSATFHATALP